MTPTQDWARPVTLEGRWVRVEPLGPEHVEGLVAVGLAPELWRWTIWDGTSPDRLRGWIEGALATAADGSEVPFAIIERASGRPVGSTRYLSIVPDHWRLEIGWTWVAPPWQRSAVNSETKLLLLEHAFERLGANRVEFKTDSLNEQSRTALAGIGAVEEGTFRNHMVTQGGRLRHSVFFSVIADEWATVKEGLQRRLEREAGRADGERPAPASTAGRQLPSRP